MAQQNIDLALKIAGGDRDAENELFRLFRERIEFMVRIRLKGKATKEDQEDIISEIQEAILLNLRKGAFDPERGKSLDVYIAGISSNIVGQYFRRQKKGQITEPDRFLETVSIEDDTLTDMVNDERNNKLRTYLARLKPKYKEVLLLRIYEKKSIAEIAQLLNLEPRRVSERIHYAFKLFLDECRKDNYFHTKT